MNQTEKMTVRGKIAAAAALGVGGLVLSAMSVFAADPTVSSTDANTLIGAIVQLVKDFYFTNTLVATALTLVVLIALAFKAISWVAHRRK